MIHFELVSTTGTIYFELESTLGLIYNDLVSTGGMISFSVYIWHDIL